MNILTIQAQNEMTKQSITTPINSWIFYEANSSTSFSASVPGNVHDDLVRANQLANPLIGTNENESQWVAEKAWVYELKNIQLNENFKTQAHWIIRLHGIDTYARVYWDNQLIGQTNNAFVAYTFDLPKSESLSNHTLRIAFEPALAQSKKLLATRVLPLPGDSVRAVCRKPQYQFGWDWGPKLITCGITHPIEVVGYNDVRLEETSVETIAIDSASAKVRVRFSLYSEFDKPINVVVREKDLGLYFADRFVAQHGLHEYVYDLDVKNPELWYPNESGSQRIYKFLIDVHDDKGQHNTKVIKNGIRTVELVTEKDAKGESFYFKVNGKRIFMKGANLIPVVMLPRTVNESEYRALLQRCKDAHFNMLRVWGGGQYESDLFYELCDEMGIMIWHDFMFACSMYPGDAQFLQNVQVEAKQQVQRISHHACMALWCGNKENAEGWSNWGWKIGLSQSAVVALDSEYDALFNQLLPNAVHAYSQLPYVPSSPRFGRGNAQSLVEGDSHYWGLWHDEEPFSVLQTKVPRFMSEFGMQSFPSTEVLQLISPQDPYNQTSAGYAVHQKHPKGFALMKKYTETWYPNASKLSTEEYATLTQKMQAEGMCMGIEAQRADAQCGGTLYWQLNDVWPSFSWSSIDYLGKEKLFHQQLKVSYAPQLLTYKVENDTLKLIWIDDQFTEPYDLYYGLDVSNGKKSIGTNDRFVRITSNITALPEEVALSTFKHKTELDLRLFARTPSLPAYERRGIVRRVLKK